MVHYLAMAAVGLAGIAFVLAAWIRWRLLGQPDSDRHSWVWPVWLGIGALTLGLGLAMFDSDNGGFRFGVLTSLAGIAAVFFVARFLTLPSRGLLVLPVGGMAVLVALSSGIIDTDETGGNMEGWPNIVLIIHIAIMMAHLAAMLFAGAVGVTYLITAKKLKTSLDAALELPSLSLLERLCERGIVIATALLIAGLVTGGAVMRYSDAFSISSLPAISGMLSMSVLVIMLALRLTGRLHRSHLAFGSLVVLGLAFLSVVSVFAGHYVG